MFYNFEKRNRDFMKAVEAEYMANRADGRRSSVESILRGVLKQPAPSFYVDVCHAQRVVRERLAGKARHRPGTLHDQMWDEIVRRVERRAAQTGKSLDDATIDVLDAGLAPRFYMTPAYAIRLFQRLYNHD